MPIRTRIKGIRSNPGSGDLGKFLPCGLGPVRHTTEPAQARARLVRHVRVCACSTSARACAMWRAPAWRWPWRSSEWPKQPGIRARCGWPAGPAVCPTGPSEIPTQGSQQEGPGRYVSAPYAISQAGACQNLCGMYIRVPAEQDPLTNAIGLAGLTYYYY